MIPNDTHTKNVRNNNNNKTSTTTTLFGNLTVTSLASSQSEG